MAAYKIPYSPEALEEMKMAVAYYNKQSKGLGSRFKSSLLAEIAAIKEQPFSRSTRYENVRFAVVSKFPYAAHYTVHEDVRIIKI